MVGRNLMVQERHKINGERYYDLQNQSLGEKILIRM
jgi:hypothetical protein